MSVAVLYCSSRCIGRSPRGHLGRWLGPEIDLFVFDRSPEPLDKDIVLPGAAAVHADFDAEVFQNLRERDRCKLAALVIIRAACQSRRAVHSGPAGNV